MAPVTLDYAAERRPTRWRTRAAIVLALAGGLSSGYALSFAGFGFFLVWIVLTVACPVVVCFVTGSRHRLVAMLSVAAMMGYLLFRVVVPAAGGMPWQPKEQLRTFILMAVLAGVSLLIAGIVAAFAARRRSA